MAIMLHQSNGRNLGQERVLLVGFGKNHSGFGGQAADVPQLDGVLITTYLHALDGNVLRDANPDLVICALFAPESISGGADVVAIIGRLQTLGYNGRIAVLAPDIPRPDLVQAELRALGPGERLTLIVTAA